jgi:hypothetical protein
MGPGGLDTTGRACYELVNITQLILDLGSQSQILTMSQARHWCFTLNNYTDAEQHFLCTHGEEISIDDASSFSYLVFGRETAPTTGTPHLQGYLTLRKKNRLSYLKTLPGFERAAFFIARGSPKQASDYAKKEGDFEEYGSLVVGRGNAASFEQLRDWIAAQETAPTYRDVWEEFPSLAARYKSAVMDCIELFGKRPQLVDGNLRLWQHALNERVNGPADDRKIVFIVNPEGNCGKSWLTRYWMTHRIGTQFFSVGKRDDLAYSVDVNNDLFVFDIPRGNMLMLQYGFLEMLKNQLVYSPKYSSMTKIIRNKPHVVVFCNEHPDMEKLTEDRYKIIEI